MFSKALPSNAMGYFAGLGGIAAVTGMCALLRSHINEMTVALAMLLVVLFVAARWERWPALVTSVVGMLCLNYYFLPPIYTLTIADPKNWVALGAFFITAVTAGRLSAWAKQEAAVAAASRSQARLASAYNRSLLEASLDPLVTIGRDGKINDVNAAAETITGYSRADLIGTDFSAHFIAREKAQRAYQDVLRGEKVRGYALELRHRGGHSTSVLYDGSLYRDAEGNVIGVVAAARPIGAYAGRPLPIRPDPRVVRHLNLFVRFACLFSVLVGALSILGLTLHVELLKSVVPGRPVIKMNAAVCLILLGVSFWLLRKRDLPHYLQIAGRVIAIIVALAGFVVSTEYVLGRSLGIDELLFREPAADVFFSRRPGLIAPITAFDFLLLGLALVLLDRPISFRSRTLWPSQYLASCTALLALLGVLDNVLGAQISYTRVATQTAAALLVLSLAVLCARTDRGLAPLLASSTEGGALIRRLLPAAIVISVAIGAASWKALSTHRYSEWSAITFMMIAMIVLVSALATWNGYIVNRGEVERQRAEAALHRSEMELREAQRLAQVGSWWWEPAADRVTWSAELSHLARRDPLLPPPTYPEHLRFFTAESSRLLHGAVQEAMRTGVGFELELELVRADGAVRSVTERGEIERNGEGKVALVRGTIEDITERKQAEQALQRSTEEIQDLYNRAPCGYHSLDTGGLFVRINDTELEWLGRAREEVIGQPFTSFVTAEGRQTFLQSFPRLKSAGLAQNFEYEMVRKDGSTFPALLSASAITGPSGEFVMSRSTMYDITERKRAEQERAQLAAIVECSNDAIISKALDQRILTWNAGAERTFGYTAREIVGRPISILVPPDKLDELQNLMARLERGESTEHLETVRVTKDGRQLDVSVTISPIRNAAGDVIGAATISHDITARKRAENEIRQLALRQAVVAELGQQALRADPSEKVLDEAVISAVQSLGADYARVLELMPDGKTFLLRAGVGWKDGTVGHATVSADTSTQAGFALESKEPVILEDLRTETRFHSVPMFGDPDIVSGMSVVISTSEGPYGVLSVHTRQPRKFTNDEVNFLQSIGNVLGIMIERRRAEAELLRINRAQRALSSCNEALIRATEEATLLDRICRLIIEQAGYRFCWVGRAENDDAKSVQPVAQSGFEEGYLDTLAVTWADTERGRGPTGACIRTGQNQIVKDFATDPRLGPWRAEALKRGYASSLAVPLVVDSKIFGALTIYSAETEAFGPSEVALLTELADDLGFGITTLHTRAERERAEEENRKLTAELEQRVARRTAQLQAANEEIAQAREREIEIGYRIQQTLLLDQPPLDVPGLRLAAVTIPSQRIDGDFYIFLRHSAECLDVIVGDVMGKGINAALLGAATKSHFLRALSDLKISAKDSRLPEPREIVMLAHAELAPHLIELDSFVTLCYARLNARQRTLTYVDCGHTAIIHRQAASGRCDLLHGENLPLGVLEGEIYDQFSVSMEPGDLLLFYSDGITEARNASGELFGLTRLEEYVRLNGDVDPGALVQGIRKGVAAFSGDGRLADDLTGVAIRIEEAQFALAHAEIEISSGLVHLRRARDFVRGFSETIPGPPLAGSTVDAIELAVNETMSNIMKHAYHGRADQWIHLEAEAFPTHVVIRMHHFGDPFDPSSAPPPQLDGSRESGFGAYIISRSMDEVRYYRDERGRNCVTLIKFREPENLRKGNVA